MEVIKKFTTNFLENHTVGNNRAMVADLVES